MLVCNALDVTIDFVLSKEYVSTTSVLDNEILKELSLHIPRNLRIRSEGTERHSA